MKEKQKENLIETDDRVKLKPFLGMRPGVYLTILYSIILLFILFLILLRPGLRNPGAQIVFNTEPQGAALRVNDIYAGTSPDVIFVPKGQHVMEVVLPGFQTESFVHDVPGRVFGSLIFPRREPLEITLKTNDAAGAFALSAANYAAWTFGGEPTATWQIPLSLSEGAYRIGGFAQDTEIKEILTASSRFVATRAALRDLLRSKFLIDNAGGAPTPASMFGSVSDILLFLSENQGSASWLAGLLPAESAAIVKNSDWFKNTASPTEAALPAAGNSRPFLLAGLSFNNVAEGTFTQDEPFPHNVDIDGFFISENPVSGGLYDTYLNETGKTASGTAIQGNVIFDVSWHDAAAFCEWLTGKLPASMANMKVRLPTEAELAYAAKLNKIILITDTWEWCNNLYTHLPFIKGSPQAEEKIGSSWPQFLSKETALRGGSSFETRASLPADFSSPFVTFRPVIANR